MSSPDRLSWLPASSHASTGSSGVSTCTRAGGCSAGGPEALSGPLALAMVAVAPAEQTVLTAAAAATAAVGNTLLASSSPENTSSSSSMLLLVVLVLLWLCLFGITCSWAAPGDFVLF